MQLSTKKDSMFSSTVRPTNSVYLLNYSFTWQNKDRDGNIKKKWTSFWGPYLFYLYIYYFLFGSYVYSLLPTEFSLLKTLTDI